MIYSNERKSQNDETGKPINNLVTNFRKLILKNGLALEFKLKLKYFGTFLWTAEI